MLLGLSGCVVVFGCVSCGTPSAAPYSWRLVLSKQTPTLLSVWGTGSDDVFAVGGPLGNETPSAMVHYDGHSWHDLSPGGTETFWWTHGTSPTDVWAVGERGRIMHFDGAHFVESPRMTSATLYGVWAAAQDDVWAVGGTPDAGSSAPNDVVLHYDGRAWSALLGPPAMGFTFFKVWGTSSSNLYVVGEGGTIWHRIGSQWHLESNPPLVQASLFTVHGSGPGEVYAVGGSDVLRWDGTKWSIFLELSNGVNGVACSSPGNAVIVGYGGLKERLANGRWHDDSTDEPLVDLHGSWAGPGGRYYAAGGDFSTAPVDGGARAGLVAYYGP
jgi:hypothetical protein